MRSGSTRRRGPSPRRAGGFTYLWLLLLIVLIGLALSAAGEVWRTAARREREAELLFAGRQYRQAIARFYVEQHRYPATLAEMLAVDDGGNAPRRYLRRLYTEPITRGPWTLIPAQQGGIQGVASASLEPPLKRSGFDDDWEFENAQAYADWAFVFDPRRPRRPSVAAGAAPPVAAR
jgi:type II secretory pathway pseudopilin PulG